MERFVYKLEFSLLCQPASHFEGPNKSISQGQPAICFYNFTKLIQFSLLRQKDWIFCFIFPIPFPFPHCHEFKLKICLISKHRKLQIISCIFQFQLVKYQYQQQSFVIRGILFKKILIENWTRVRCGSHCSFKICRAG